MATVVTNAMLDTIDARLRKMAFETKGNIPMIGDKIVKTETIDSRYKIFNRVYGVGEASEVDEGAVYTQKEIKQDTNKTISVKKYGFVINVSRELILDNLFEPIQDDVAKAMANSMKQTKERKLINLINNGFATTTAQDGEYLFSTSHPLGQGGTQSNLASTATALDLDSLWTGRNTMRTTKGQSGLYDAIYDAQYIVVPQALERKANELLRSEWVPYKTENQSNVIRSIAPGIEVLVSPLLSSTTAWFLIANPGDVPEFALRLVMREPMSINALFNIQGSTELGNSIDRDVYSWRCRERYEADAVTWFGVYGNAGA